MRPPLVLFEAIILGPGVAPIGPLHGVEPLVVQPGVVQPGPSELARAHLGVRANAGGLVCFRKIKAEI